jgi:hypothetical protein
MLAAEFKSGHCLDVESAKAEFPLVSKMPSNNNRGRDESRLQNLIAGVMDEESQCPLNDQSARVV